MTTPSAINQRVASTPKVSIVILCWNRRKDIDEGLERIQALPYPNLETIVVDNASTDGTPEMIKRKYPRVILMEMGKNIGVAAYNAGFKKASGEYVVILDDDSFPAENAIDRMVTKFERDTKLGIVAFDVRNYTSYDDVCTDNAQSPDATTANSGKYLMSFNGAGAGVRREVFEKAGYYPGEFFLYWNEQDLAFRVFNAGYKIEFFPDVVSYHKYSPENRASWRAPFYYTRNAFWLIWKNYPLQDLFQLTLRMIYMVLYYTLEQQTPIYLKALWAAFYHSDKVIPLRNPVQPSITKRLRAPLELSFTFYR